jgi:hypothetical protein
VLWKREVLAATNLKAASQRRDIADQKSSMQLWQRWNKRSYIEIKQLRKVEALAK